MGVVKLCSKAPSPLTPYQPARVPNNREWATLRPVIEGLYTRKRHKLRHIMQHVERVYGLRASEQTYKKRLAQWGLHKNSKRDRSTTSSPESQSPPTSDDLTIADCRSITKQRLSPGPGFSNDDRLKLIVLHNVQAWSSSFFEARSYQDHSYSLGQPYPTLVGDFVLAFKMADDLLARGHGRLAGKLTRKAFLMLENINLLDGPVLLWNLLEIMHRLVTLGREDLCDTMTRYLSMLAVSKMSRSHPLAFILHSFRELLGARASTTALAQDVSTPASDRSESSSADTLGTSTTSSRDSSLQLLQDVLKQSWAINARILFENLDARFFGLYCNIDWDVCSLALSAAEINAARSWYSSLESKQEDVEDRDHPTVHVNQDVSSLDAKPSLVETFENVRVNSIKALKRDWSAITDKSMDSKHGNSILIRMLCVLVSAQILQRPPSTTYSDDATYIETPNFHHLYVGHVASAVRILSELDGQRCIQQDGNQPGVVEALHLAIALREYAHGKTDLRAVRDVWSLRDVFAASGEYDKAREAEQDALQRLAEYVHDIPNEFV